MRPVPMLSVTSHGTERHRTITEAAEVHGVSKYTVVNAYFTETCLPDGAWMDLDLSVDEDQERRLWRSWTVARMNSARRRDGELEEELQDNGLS